MSKKIGLMGFGTIAQGRHAPAIFDTEGIELHAVFEPHEGRRARAEEDLGIPHVNAAPGPFFESGIEAVSVVSPAALRIRDLVRERAVGEVRSLRLVYNWGALGKYEAGPDRLRGMRDGRMREGGPFVDCGTHQIDLAGFWLGSEVVRYNGHGAWVDDYPAPDHVWVHMEHAGGAHTTVEVSYSLPRRPRGGRI